MERLKRAVLALAVSICVSIFVGIFVRNFFVMWAAGTCAGFAVLWFLPKRS